MLISTDIVSDISQEKVTKLKWKIYFILDAFDTNLMQLQIIIEIMNNKEIIQQRIKANNGQVTIKLYEKAEMLGKGGFAKCYKGIELETQRQVAIKIIEKTNLIKNRAKQKLLSQIKIHRALKHQYIVDFDTVFEDEKNVYIILELCRCRTLGEMVKKRKHLTASETRYYVKQLLQALEYLHKNKVIHRDLKMGNIFLDENMDLKLGDFGLSAKLEFCDEKKRTMAGTPNYIAPQIIEGTGGHSYQVDLWSTGVICFALLYGRPPFETSELKMTYSKIKNCEYNFPSSVTVPQAAKDFISNILVLDPKKRMTISEMEQHPFLKGPSPIKIPKTALKQVPHFDKQDIVCSKTQPINQIKNKILINTQNLNPQPQQTTKRQILSPSCRTQKLCRSPSQVLVQNNKNQQNSKAIKSRNQSTEPFKYTTQPHLKPGTNLKLFNETFSPHIQVYVDYSTKYGLGYYLTHQILDNDIKQCKKVYGVYFNDSTILSFDEQTKMYYYIINPSQKDDVTQIEKYSLTDFPEQVKNYSKKKLLLQKFHNHLVQELETKPENARAVCNYPINNIQPPTYVKQWLKTKHAVMFRLSNKIFQVNFQDHSQILLNTHQKHVFFTSKKGEVMEETLNEALSEKHRETQLGRRIKYTREILNSLKKEQRG